MAFRVMENSKSQDLNNIEGKWSRTFLNQFILYNIKNKAITSEQFSGFPISC